jgi:hypothetical protein
MSSDSVIVRRAPVWGGLLAGAIGIYVQKAGGVHYDTIAPGAVIFVVGALLVLLPWSWAPVFGILVGLFMVVGFIANSDSVARLGHPGDFLTFIGTWIQVIGVIAALVGAVALTFTRRRTAKARSSQS